MERVHARYPFLRDAKAAVEDADVDLMAVIESEPSPILQRAVERVRGAIDDGRVPDPSPDSEVELLSYPVARILVSLVDNPVLTNRYALAEARRAFDLLGDELRSDSLLRSSRATRLSEGELLEEFDLADRVRPTEDGYEVAVTAYLMLTTELREHRWRLVNRGLSDGMVPIRREALETLMQEAIRLRVADGLPLDVPEPIADGLSDYVGEIQASLADVRIPTDIDRIEPDAFPTCMRRLYDQMRTGEDLSHTERFTLVSFFCAIGGTADDIIKICEITQPSERERVRYQVEHVHGETRSTAYPPPTCETLASLGMCDLHEACTQYGHPLATYEANLVADQS